MSTPIRPVRAARTRRSSIESVFARDPARWAWQLGERGSMLRNFAAAYEEWNSPDTPPPLIISPFMGPSSLWMQILHESWRVLVCLFYSWNESSRSTREPLLKVFSYGPMGGDYDHGDSGMLRSTSLIQQRPLSELYIVNFSLEYISRLGIFLPVKSL